MIKGMEKEFINGLQEQFSEELVEMIETGYAVRNELMASRILQRKYLPPSVQNKYTTDFLYVYDLDYGTTQGEIVSAVNVDIGEVIPFAALRLGAGYPERKYNTIFSYSDSKLHNSKWPAITIWNDLNEGTMEPTTEYWALYGIVGKTFKEVFDQLSIELREQVLIERLS